MQIGKAVADCNDYYVCELFVRDEEGSFVLIGYGVFNPEGEFLNSFSTLAEAEEYLYAVAGPRDPAPDYGY